MAKGNAKQMRTEATTLVDEWTGVCSERMSETVLYHLLKSFVASRNGPNAEDLRALALYREITVLTQCIGEKGFTDELGDFLRGAADGGLADPEAE
jgi:hypothetical protein